MIRFGEMASSSRVFLLCQRFCFLSCVSDPLNSLHCHIVNTSVVLIRRTQLFAPIFSQLVSLSCDIVNILYIVQYLHFGYQQFMDSWSSVVMSNSNMYN